MGTGPIIYEVQTRCWLNELGQNLTLDKVPDRAIQDIKNSGATWLWLMGVWQTGEAGRQIAVDHPDLQASYQAALSDFSKKDVIGSPYAIRDYHVHTDFGCDKALAILRQRLADFGIKLMLDFVPNHVAVDNQWAAEFPNYFIRGNKDDLAAGRGMEIDTRCGKEVLLHGRDPYFPPWTDTLQLNWAEPGLIDELKKLLVRLAGQCDGLRCDMAMLLLKEVFIKTWGREISSYEEPWKELIDTVKAQYPDFIFAAEAYWDLEWQLTCQGFDYVYDKRLYDRLCQGDAAAVNGHLLMDGQFHRKQLHFLENHDEPRLAGRLSTPQCRAAAALVSFLPGAWLFHHHQQHGALIKLPVQLRRYAKERPDNQCAAFYQQLFDQRSTIKQEALWSLLKVHRAWDGNNSCEQIIASGWAESGHLQKLLVVNYSPNPAQCYVELDRYILKEATTLQDPINNQVFERVGSDLLSFGLFVSLEGYGFHYFNVV